MSRLRTAHRVGLVVGSFAIGAAVVACGPMHPGAAATVGSTRISVADLNAAVAHDSAGAPPTAPADRTAAVQASLTTLIQKDLISDAAKAKGVTVSEADVQAFLAQQRQTNGTDEGTAQANNIPFAELHEVVYEQLLGTRVIAAVAGSVTDKDQQTALFRDYIGKIALKEGVSISPRYGTWQADKFTVVPSDAFSSTKPVASAPVG